MPLANVFSKIQISRQTLQSIVTDWAKGAELDTDDVTINVIPEFMQEGMNYSLLVNLYFRSLWPEEDVIKIQTSLVEALQRNLKTPSDEILVISCPVHSGHMVENGDIVRW